MGREIQIERRRNRERKLDQRYFVCLFMVYRTTREFFTHGNVTITGEGLQILTYARHSWPLSSEGS